MAVMPVSAALRLAEEHLAAGRLVPAINVCRRILEAAPETGAAYRLAARAARLAGDLPAAVDLGQRAVTVTPGDAANHVELAEALWAGGQFDAARGAAMRAVEEDPALAAGHRLLGMALVALREVEQAEREYRLALELDPADAESCEGLARLLQVRGRTGEAAELARRATEAAPHRPEAHNTLGNLLLSQMRLEEAAAAFRRALELFPAYPEAENNLGATLLAAGRQEEALAHYQRAVELEPGHFGIHSNLLTCRQYRPGITPAELAEHHAVWDRRHAAPLRQTWSPHENTPDPGRRLRLGFVSNDFAQHPVGFFIAKVLESLDRQACRVTCYSDRLAGDAMTARLEAAADDWVPIAGHRDEEVARRIREDRIDLLFDLAGHTGLRLRLFARKPAPVQITWLGYEGTTGVSAIDYLLADRHVVPPGTETHYREEVVWLPRGYVCYAPPEDAPPPGPLPALAGGGVTFGSFNNPAKLNAEVIALWSRVLGRVPGSRLVLKYRGLDEPGTQRHFRERFAAEGVDPSRVEFRGWSDFATYLAQYGRVDVGLDPFPFCGGATSCESLWMGVPVVTLPGATLAGRHTLGHLHAVGHAEYIAADADDYVAIAARAAGDLPRLAAVRSALRGEMASSSLCDGPGFARDLEQALRELWRRWCQGRRAGG